MKFLNKIRGNLYRGVSAIISFKEGKWVQLKGMQSYAEHDFARDYAKSGTVAFEYEK